MPATWASFFSRPLDATTLTLGLPVVAATSYALFAAVSALTGITVLGYAGHAVLVYFLVIAWVSIRILLPGWHRLRLFVEIYTLWHATVPPLHALTYMVQTSGMPLQDRAFEAFDRSVLSFDFAAFMSVIDHYPLVHDVLWRAYDSFFAQVVLTFLALMLLGKVRETERYLVAFLTALVVTTLLSAGLPAYGAIGLARDIGLQHFHFTGASPAAHITALRDGSMDVIDLRTCGGIISFPSFHAAGAFVVTCTWRRRPAVFVPLLALNAVMSVAAVTEGAHYACDVLAGFAVAAASLWLAGRLVPPVAAQAPAEVPSMAEAAPQRLAA